MTKKAIVFDNSGTLLERFRVIKDVSTGEFITHVNSLDLIDTCLNAALVVLQFNTTRLKDLDPNCSSPIQYKSSKGLGSKYIDKRFCIGKQHRV